MLADAGANHCYFAYDFNAAMISNSIGTVHSVPSNGRHLCRVSSIDRAPATHLVYVAIVAFTFSTHLF